MARLDPVDKGSAPAPAPKPPTVTSRPGSNTVEQTREQDPNTMGPLPSIGTSPPAGGAYTFAQLEQIWIMAGGNPASAPMAAAIALAESAGRPGATNDNTNGSIDRGLWQINSVHGAQSTYDIMANARAAVAISANGASWHPWTTFTTGAYKQFLQNTPPATGPLPNISGTTDTGAAAATPGAATPNAGSAPPMTDMPGLIKYIQTNFGADAWLLNVPDVAATLEKAVSQGLTPDQVTALIEQTPWWKSTAQSMIAYDQLKNQNPEDLNFNNPGSKASAVLANIVNIAGTVGVQLGANTLRQIATQAMMYGWSNQQIQQHLGANVTVTPRGLGVQSNDPSMLAQLTKAAGSYLINPNQTILNQYAQALASGTKTEADWEAYLQQQAVAKYPSMAQGIKAGMTPTQIIDPLRQDAAKLMEVTPDSINFISDPTYARILTYRPPDAAGKVQPIRTMSTSEMETYLRGTDQYSYTQGARDTASDLSNAILTTFGKVAS